MAADRTGRVWDEVRRALGRLAGRVSSHSLPEAEVGISATVHHSTVTQFSDPVQGVRQGEWQSFAQTRSLPTLAAVAGGGGVDPSSVATIIGADRVLGTNVTNITEAVCRIAGGTVHVWTLGRDMPSVPAVPGPRVRFDDVAARQAVIVFRLPVIRPINVARAMLSQASKLADWQIKTGRVHAGLAPILRVPLLCRRMATSPGEAAFGSERRLLAAAAAAPEADVALIGVFPHVPLAAVQKLSVAPDGMALQIWLRPDAVGRRAATVTVVLGRQRSTGKMLQAVSRDLRSV